MSKKQLDTAAIQNELQNSSFFPSPQSPPPLQPAPAPSPVPPVRDVRSVLPVRGVPPVRRSIKQRHPFDIYADQLESLRARALEERKQGGLGSMSAMVREAIDDYLDKTSDH